MNPLLPERLPEDDAFKYSWMYDMNIETLFTKHFKDIDVLRKSENKNPGYFKTNLKIKAWN